MTSDERATQRDGWRGRLRPTREQVSHALLVAVLFGASLFLATSGVWFGQYFVEKGAAFEPLHEIDDGMFRWDSVYYFSIATTGYAYDGDPCRPQNVVFLPAFPLLVRGVSALSGLGVRGAGFWVVRLSLLIGAFVLFRWVFAEQGLAAAVFVVAGIFFSPGSLAFHAWYSESTMLLFLALALTFYRRGSYLAMGCAAFVLGATRVTALPFVALMALACVRRVYRRMAEGRQAAMPRRVGPVIADLVAAVLCVGGFVAWLGYLGLEFGNPLALIADIKYCAWSKVHQPMSLFEGLTLSPLIQHIGSAFERPYYFVLDLKTTNLLWTLAAAIASVWAVIRRRGDLVSLGFIGYFALTFYATGKSEWLESSFRYYVPMFTIYLAGHAVWAWSRARWPQPVVDAAFGALFAVQVMYMVFYQALFTVQRGHFF